ncbi:MAG: hypothetical protein P1Q69_16125 [Candidatus Thorarchaeota archaeon]|nr:hypothetical protein [Candidatus Thorarchaeota archaeon]
MAPSKSCALLLAVLLVGMVIVPVLSPYAMKHNPAMASDFALSESLSPPTWNYTTNEQWTKSSISDDGSTIHIIQEKLLHLLSPSSNSSIWSFNASERINTVSTCVNGSVTAIGTFQGSGLIYLLGLSSNDSLWVYNATNWIVDVAVSLETILSLITVIIQRFIVGMIGVFLLQRVYKNRKGEHGYVSKAMQYGMFFSSIGVGLFLGAISMLIRTDQEVQRENY